ncbi:hypothetical protein HHX47_DHR6000161 [Lentinula edodes]|nr:hypothetical protein HHX47_DHR6000161 [Lentinula edodes]
MRANIRLQGYIRLDTLEPATWNQHSMNFLNGLLPLLSCQTPNQQTLIDYLEPLRPFSWEVGDGTLEKRYIRRKFLGEKTCVYIDADERNSRRDSVS